MNPPKSVNGAQHERKIVTFQDFVLRHKEYLTKNLLRPSTDSRVAHESEAYSPSPSPHSLESGRLFNSRRDHSFGRTLFFGNIYVHSTYMDTTTWFGDLEPFFRSLVTTLPGRLSAQSPHLRSADDVGGW